MKTKVIRCRDGLNRQFIWVAETQTMAIWKCFDCNRRIYSTKRRYAKRGRFLSELKAHTC